MKNLFLICIIGLFLTSLLADEVTEQISTANDLYSAGKYSKAAEELHFAIKLIREKQITAVAKIFPGNYTGFKGEETNTTNADAVMFGGAIEVTKNYYDANGNSLTLTVLAESPLIASFSSMLMFSGQNVIKIKQYKAIIDYTQEGQYGEIQFILDDNKTLVKVACSNVAKDILMEFAKSVDYTKIEESLK